MTSNIKKVAVIGPECTGKSDLSAFLANHFKTVWVPEHARDFLGNLARPYVQSDLLSIARGQLQLEDARLGNANRVLVCDTNLYVIKVWSLVKYGTCDPEILKNIASRKYDLYLLTYVDVPWEEDWLREHPHMRQQLYAMYLREMRSQPVPFTEIRGERHQRRKSAVEAIEKLLGK
jgi:NadR type nicotinamide-nucleotide adenylyltransferase